MSSQETTKVCFKCRQTSSLDSFYRHPGTKDGYLNKCKECSKIDGRAYRKETAIERRAKEKERRKPRSRTREYHKKFPERMAANYAVRKALKSGVLKRWGCMCCDETKTEAHHPDYSAPLSVVWLCRVHHAEIHLTYGGY
jgi:hypothetical protein